MATFGSKPAQNYRKLDVSASTGEDTCLCGHKAIHILSIVTGQVDKVHRTYLHSMPDRVELAWDPLAFKTDSEFGDGPRGAVVQKVYSRTVEHVWLGSMLVQENESVVEQ